MDLDYFLKGRGYFCGGASWSFCTLTLKKIFVSLLASFLPKIKMSACKLCWGRGAICAKRFYDIHY